MTPSQIVHQIATSKAWGLVGYDQGWGETTPGTGPEYGCRWCGRQAYGLSYADERDGRLPADFEHEATCVWVASRKFLGLPSGAAQGNGAT